MHHEIIRHTTIENCLANYYKCEEKDLEKQCDFLWKDETWSVARVIKSRKEIGTWGWCESKKNIHIWVADYASPKNIIRLISHELGHKQRPYKKNFQQEEEKAEAYSDVALMAFEVMMELKGEIKWQNVKKWILQ